MVSGMTHARRLTGRRTAALAVALLAAVPLAVLGLLLPGPGRALAGPRPGLGATLTVGGPTCAIEAGQAYCWGSGALGDGNSPGSSSVPVAVYTRGVLAGKTLTQIGAAFGYACALDTSGAAYCWGTNDHGQLGFGVLGFSDVPVPVDTKGVLAGKKLVQISVGQLGACALDSTGHAYCWGGNTVGELGNGSTSAVGSDVPVAVDTSGALAGKTLTQISAGAGYACALDTTGAAYCWGDDRFGELGDASGMASDVPVAVDASGVLAGRKLVGISANINGSSTCAVDAGGSAYCWGFDFYGQLGDGSSGSDSAVLPVAVNTSGALAGKTLTQISTGFDETCALDSTGAAYCWGDNFYGELGDDSRTASPLPVAVDTSGALAGKTLSQISAGSDGFFACAMSTSGAVYCWGAVTDGSAGSTVPVAAGPSPVTGVSAVSGQRSARVSWKAPAMSAGVTGYSAIANPGEEICITRTTSCTIGGLRNGLTYSVTVVAHTGATNSAASAPVSVTPGSGVVFTSTPYAIAAFGARFGFTVRATGRSPLIAIKGLLPPGVTFTRHANGTATLAGTPDRGAVGVYPLTFTAKSRAGIATQAFTLAVTRAPALAKLPSVLTLKAHEAVDIPIKTIGYPAAQLLSSGRIPGGLSYHDFGNGTGAILGNVAGQNTAGRWVFTVIAASASGVATHTIVLIVALAPEITSPYKASAAIGFTFSFHVTATGFPAPKITESGQLPKGVTFNSATATLSGIPRSGTKGSYPFIFTATNSAGARSQAFTLTVT